MGNAVGEGMAAGRAAAGRAGKTCLGGGPLYRDGMETIMAAANLNQMLRSQQFWIWVIGIIALISLIRGLYKFNKIILGVAVVCGIAVYTIFSKPAWMEQIWSKFN